MATVLLAGCAGTQTQAGAPAAARATTAAPISMTMAHYVPQALHPDRRKSWMLPHKGRSILMYVDGANSSDVYVYDYPSGELVGTLTGFDYPYGGCVDAKGDVYIANFSGGNVVEYAHGGSSIINTYTTGGEPIGCSVDAKGDLAATNFSPAQAVVFAGGDPTKGTTYASCAQYQWTMGYDNEGNLIGNGYGSLICGLLKGANSMTALSASGITIVFPGGTMWDGKYIAVGDQEANGGFGTGIYEASLTGSTLTSHGEALLTDTCDSNYADVVNPFILGKKNTPVNDRQGKVVPGANLDCGTVNLWHYPKGGNPFKTYEGIEGGGVTISIGR